MSALSEKFHLLVRVAVPILLRKNPQARGQGIDYPGYVFVYIHLDQFSKKIYLAVFCFMQAQKKPRLSRVCEFTRHEFGYKHWRRLRDES